MTLSATSTLFYNTSKDDNSTTSLSRKHFLMALHGINTKELTLKALNLICALSRRNYSNNLTELASIKLFEGGSRERNSSTQCLTGSHLTETHWQESKCHTRQKGLAATISLPRKTPLLCVAASGRHTPSHFTKGLHFHKHSHTGFLCRLYLPHQISLPLWFSSPVIKSVHRPQRERSTPQITATPAVIPQRLFSPQPFHRLIPPSEQQKASTKSKILNLWGKGITNYLRIYMQGTLLLKYVSFIFMYI